MKKVMNILLGILMVITIVLLVYAIATGGSEAAISVNLIWCYVLIVAAIAAALFCAPAHLHQTRRLHGLESA